MIAQLTTVRVTREHIESGNRRNCAHCPVANAIRDETGKLAQVRHHVIKLGRYHRIETPAVVRNWIDAYDAGKAVKPFEFEIEI